MTKRVGKRRLGKKIMAERAERRKLLKKNSRKLMSEKSGKKKRNSKSLSYTVDDYYKLMEGL